jgi:hypothetical protein
MPFTPLLGFLLLLCVVLGPLPSLKSRLFTTDTCQKTTTPNPIITFTPWTPHWRQVNDVERDCKGRLALCRGLGCPRKTSFLSLLSEMSIYAADQPLSTARIAPLTLLASSEARKAMADAICSGLTTPPDAEPCTIANTLCSPASWGIEPPSPIAVSTAPGQTALQRIPWAILFVKPMTPFLSAGNEQRNTTMLRTNHFHYVLTLPDEEERAFEPTLQLTSVVQTDHVHP